MAGTLSGAVLTYLFGRRSALRTERTARREQIRADRISAYLAFAEAVTDCRRAAYDGWHRQHDRSDQDVVAEASAEYYRYRSAAEHALLRIKLVASDAREIVGAAREALDAATQVQRAKDESHVTELGDHAARKVDTFIAVAASQIQ
ncbi:hypothetical protein SAMN05216215_10866 [Saccharopolyspora shandongensis]|uniref:Uncharacterized protein n=1 Tax=Saccharopolyspora shandongensis TaxID=418495 RepID=A0A1H3TK37_9PSEU|nr:hypothetical protein [Saccharopolyspora shandongensis]SDZ50682.1 hypothetical protein SAMN05216215_10866 [Saccharopolyspora shandongensis]